MSDLKRRLVRLAYENPDGIREHLLPLLHKTAKGDEEEEGGNGKGPSKLMMTFIREMGDKEVRHPDPDTSGKKTIKIKSLSGGGGHLGGWREKAYKDAFEREFSKWRKSYEERQKKEEGDKKKDEK